MFTDDGTMLSCQKSIFMQKLEGLLVGEAITTIDGADAMIIDANAVIHTLHVPNIDYREVTYSDMANDFLTYSVQMSRRICKKNMSEIHIVFDRYFSNSVKIFHKGKENKRIESKHLSCGS